MGINLKNWLRFRHTRYEFIRSLAKGSVVLDIGCGNGQMQERLAQCRADLNFISVDKLDYSWKFEPLKFFQVDLSRQKLPLAANSIDAVFTSHVLEHLTSHELLVFEIKRVIRPTGSVYIEAPSTRSLFVPSFRGCTGTINFYDDPTHIRPFTRCSIHQIGEKIGIKRIRTGFARNWLYCLLAPLILVYSIIKRDRRMFGVVLWSIVGWSVYIWGEGVDK